MEESFSSGVATFAVLRGGEGYDGFVKEASGRGLTRVYSYEDVLVATSPWVELDEAVDFIESATQGTKSVDPKDVVELQ